MSADDPHVADLPSVMRTRGWADYGLVDSGRGRKLEKVDQNLLRVNDVVAEVEKQLRGVKVQAGSALPRSKAAKQQFILDLWDRKLEQDPRKVRDMLELSQGEPDEWEKDINQAERENRKMQLGQVVEVKEWMNHPAHHFQHRDFMKSPEYDELDPEIRKIFEDHDEEQEPAQTLFPQCQERHIAVLLGGVFKSGILATGPVPGAKSDHKMTFFYDDEQQKPIPQSRIDAWIKSH